MSNFILYKEDIDRLNKVLTHLLSSASATFVLLVHKDGNLLAHQGYTKAFDTTALAALAAGSYAATRAIAQMIGENEFTVLFHKGRTDNIHISLVDEDCILVLVFDDRTNPGLVRLESEKAIKGVNLILEDVRKNEFTDLDMAPPKADSVGLQMDRLFGV
ncbi:MAG: regulator of Ras-like GTPase /cell polarity determinant GTPase-activating protein MglB [Fibrobacterota bacterium]|jgi:predicted regulator of Ras-like GTPase activity (Roadblock/LC7/MglB family)